jgi:uncharacterized membrane protein
LKHVDALEVSGASIVIRPNRSLPVAGVVMLFAGVSAMSLAVGIGFALVGAWIVLAFAVAEIVIVALLCVWLYRHLDDCELIMIEAERVRVVKRRGNNVSQYDFARCWTQARVDVAGGTAERRLTIGSHGRFVSLADDVKEADRLSVARELRRLLRSSA